MRSLFFIAYFLLFAFLAYFTRDLTQYNREELFLDSQELKNYQIFHQKIEEKKVLLAQFIYENEVNYSQFNSFTNFLNTLKVQYQAKDIEILGIKEAYRQKLHDANLTDIKKFTEENKEYIIPLFTQKKLAFLAFFPQSVDQQVVKGFTHSVRQYGTDGLVQTRMAGLPFVNERLNFYSEKIKNQVFPLLFLICFVITWLVTARLRNTLILFVPSLFSVFFSLSAIKLLYADLNMITSIIPLLLFVINLSLSFHFYFSFCRYRNLRQSIERKFVPVLLTITTGTPSCCA